MKLSTTVLTINAGIIAIVSFAALYMYLLYGTSISHPIDLTNTYHVLNFKLQIAFMILAALLMWVCTFSATTTKWALGINLLCASTGLLFAFSSATMFSLMVGLLIVMLSAIGFIDAVRSE